MDINLIAQHVGLMGSAKNHQTFCLKLTLQQAPAYSALIVSYAVLCEKNNSKKLRSLQGNFFSAQRHKFLILNICIQGGCHVLNTVQHIIVGLE